MDKSRALHLLQSPFIAMPINVGGVHWALVVFAYANHLFDTALKPRPVILLFDSLGSTPKKVYQEKLGRFLSSIALRATADHDPNEEDVSGPGDSVQLFAPNVSRPSGPKRSANLLFGVIGFSSAKQFRLWSLPVAFSQHFLVRPPPFR